MDWLSRFLGWMRPFFWPAPYAESRPDPQSDAGRYIRSFLFERMVIGLLGVFLPVILIFVDRYLFHEHPYPRNSLSAYYWSGTHDWFEISLGTTGFFLIAYKITERNLDNVLSVLGGVAAILIPTFPTARTGREIAEGVKTTSLQNLFGGRTAHPAFHGEICVRWVHYGSTFFFILALGGTALLFGLRELKRPWHGNARSGRFWLWFHVGCASLIFAGGIFCAVTAIRFNGKPDWSMLAGEIACTVGFGASWFAKGAELKYVFGKPEPTPTG